MFAMVRGGSFGVVSVCTLLALAGAGCNVDGRWTKFRSVEPPAAPRGGEQGGAGVDLAVSDAREVDMVEGVVAARTQYQQGLRQLRRYYEEHGYAAKAYWAKIELQGLAAVKQFRYLVDAEIPPDTLRPADQITEADELYKKGLNYMRRGGHGLGVMHREDRMIEAAQIFRRLIERYPTSDKIDDAAFQCGEIHKNYLPGQESIAVKWYERAWTWNPETPYPARFEAAVVYDYRMHERDRALELYRKALQYEGAFGSNARFAARRIEELSGGNEPVTPATGQTQYGSP